MAALIVIVSLTVVTGALRSPLRPGLHMERCQAHFECRSEPRHEGSGAGDGIRTRDVQLGSPKRLSVVAASVERLPEVGKLSCRRIAVARAEGSETTEERETRASLPLLPEVAQRLGIRRDPLA